jgi:hypothetical protein
MLRTFGTDPVSMRIDSWIVWPLLFSGLRLVTHDPLPTEQNVGPMLPS